MAEAEEVPTVWALGGVQPVCEADACGKEASFQCPTCVKLGMPQSNFCSQECFKAAWPVHKAVHKGFRTHRPVPFLYTGPLRQAYVTPMRRAPDDVEKPDYWLTGQPVSEQEAKAERHIPVHTPRQIEGIRAACRLGRDVLDFAHRLVRPGVTTEDIDKAVHQYIVSRGAYPSPLNYYNFPKSCCTSVNEIICHGIPDCRPLQDGDILNVDISVYYRGYHGDLNETFCVGEVDKESRDLIKATHDSLRAAIEACKPGVLFRDIGKVISAFIKPRGYSVVRSYCGHGIGELFHGAPNVPHYAGNKAVGVLRPGMVFTIEPMINAGQWKDMTWPDDWTSTTVDGKRSAQFEHQLLVTQNGVEVLTGRTRDSPPLWWEGGKASPDTSVFAVDGHGPTPFAAIAAAGAEAGAPKKKKKKKKKRKKKPAAAAAEGGDEAQEEEEEDGDGSDE